MATSLHCVQPQSSDAAGQAVESARLFAYLAAERAAIEHTAFHLPVRLDAAALSKRLRGRPVLARGAPVGMALRCDAAVCELASATGPWLLWQPVSPMDPKPSIHR